MLGYLAMVDQHWQRSVGFLQEAIPPLKEAGHLVEAARALGNLGALNQKLCAWEEAKEHYTLALATHERLGHGRGQSTVLMNLSQLNTSLGWLELAIAQAERALQVAPSDPRLRCLAMNRLARAYYALGDLRRAHETSSSAAEMAAPLDLYVPLESAHRTLGEIEGLQGNWAASCKQFQSALAICQRSGSTEREVVCTARLAEVTLASGDPARGLMLADSACRTAGRLPQGGVRALARTVRGKALLAGGRPAEALTDLLEADRFLDKARVWDEAAEVSLELAKAHLQLGRLRFATLHCRAALETVEQVARRLQSEEHRYLFTHDPRRAELYETAAALRRAAERSTGDPTGEDQGGD
jgi:tetratricopeptide (TPR) repeat protein